MWHIPMGRFGPIPCCPESLLQFFCNHHGSMLTTRAANSYGEIALALVNIVGQQKRQHIGNFVQKFPGLGKLTDVLRHLGMLSSQRAELRDKVGVRKKPNIKDEIRIARDPVLEAETGDRNSEIAVVLTYSTRELGIDVRPKFMHIESRRIEKDIRNISNRIEPATFGAYGRGDRLSAAKRVRAARLRKPPDQGVVRRFKKDNSGR